MEVGVIDQQNQNTTYRSPQEPDAILSPIFNNLLSISQSPDIASADNAFSTAEWEYEQRDHDPYISKLHFHWSSFFTYEQIKRWIWKWSTGTKKNDKKIRHYTSQLHQKTFNNGKFEISAQKHKENTLVPKERHKLSNANWFYWGLHNI